MKYKFSMDFAVQMDAKDPLKAFRERFDFPQHNNKPVVYFTGNSLGLQPKDARREVEEELNNWSKYAVEGHFYAKDPWVSYQKVLRKGNAYLSGAKESEVCVMNGLSVNLHLLMASFYQPTKERYKIICEGKAFPSDQYIIETQLQHHGISVDDGMIEIPVNAETHLIDEAAIYATIDAHAASTAVLLLGGLNYYSGQRLDMAKICAYAQNKGIVVGYDLAHAIGNIELSLHEWGVDFAAWCTYKYVNSGPGAPACIFVHEKHHKSNLPRLAGWWGYKADTRFQMDKGFVPEPGADGWQLSNGPVLAMAAHRGALQVFLEAGKENIYAKRDLLTGYLEFLLQEINGYKEEKHFKIITPATPVERGSQLSILLNNKGKYIFDELMAHGIIPDWREPNVIRLAPAPLYCTFEDMYRFAKLFKTVLL